MAGPSKNLIAEYGRGKAANTTVGLVFYGVGIIAALALLGFATYWFLLSIFIAAIDARKAPFTMNYWSATYPWGVYATAFGQLGMDFDSPTFRTLNTIVTCLVSGSGSHAEGRSPLDASIDFRSPSRPSPQS